MGAGIVDKSSAGSQKSFDPQMLETGHLTVCELARGGMGSVELAVKTDQHFMRLFAIKRLHAHLQDPQFEKMFLEEARIAGMIDHPNVVSVVDVGRDRFGPYLVMNFVDGVTLNLFIKGSADLIPLQVCLRIVRDIAKGLSAAHDLTTHDGNALELVHRDLSPQNVLVGYDGSVRITDFGIAKAAGRDVTTATSVLKGKISYMSPEQLRFENPDARSDLFSLGVVMFELLTGTRLYPAGKNQVEAAQRILHESPPDIGEERQDLPPEIVSLMFRLLAKRRESRPNDAAEVADLLDEVIAHLVDAEGAISTKSWVHDATAEIRETRQRHIAVAIASAQQTHREDSQIRRVSPARKAPPPWKLLIALTCACIFVAVGLVATLYTPITSSPSEPSATIEPEELLPARAEPPIAAAMEPSIQKAKPVTSKAKARRRRRRRKNMKPVPTMPASKMQGGWVGWGTK